MRLEHALDVLRVGQGGLDPALQGADFSVDSRLGRGLGVVRLDDGLELVGRGLRGGLCVQQRVHFDVAPLDRGPLLHGGGGVDGLCVCECGLALSQFHSALSWRNECKKRECKVAFFSFFLPFTT